MMMISMIAAVAANGVIGRDNALPWELPQDMQWFRDKTRGLPVIMGRKTHAAIGRVLPQRPNIVISRNIVTDYAAGVIAVTSLDAALTTARDSHATEAMIIGGGEIYAAGLPLAHRLYLTEIDADYDGDARFPDFDRHAWRMTVLQDFPAIDAKPAFKIIQYDRV